MSNYPPPPPPGFDPNQGSPPPPGFGAPGPVPGFGAPGAGYSGQPGVGTQPGWQMAGPIGQQKSKSGCGKAALIVGILLVVLVGGLVALVAIFGEDSVLSLEKGDCFDGAAIGEISTVDKVECAEPHDNEVYAVFEMDGDDYPGVLAVDTASSEGCLERFEPFTGESYMESPLDIGYISPSEDSWDSLDDREIVCYLFDYTEPGEQQEKLEGSQAG